jgi:hypothetical protein
VKEFDVKSYKPCKTISLLLIRKIGFPISILLVSKFLQIRGFPREEISLLHKINKQFVNWQNFLGDKHKDIQNTIIDYYNGKI